MDDQSSLDLNQSQAISNQWGKKTKFKEFEIIKGFSSSMYCSFLEYTRQHQNRFSLTSSQKKRLARMINKCDFCFNFLYSSERRQLCSRFLLSEEFNTLEINILSLSNFISNLKKRKTETSTDKAVKVQEFMKKIYGSYSETFNSKAENVIKLYDQGIKSINVIKRRLSMYGPTVTKIIKKYRDSSEKPTYRSIKSSSRKAKSYDSLTSKKEEISAFFNNNPQISFTSLKEQLSFLKLKIQGI